MQEEGRAQAESRMDDQELDRIVKARDGGREGTYPRRRGYTKVALDFWE